MYIHKEGHRLLLWTGLVALGVIAATVLLAGRLNVFHFMLMALPVVLWGFFLYFFRIPDREFLYDEGRLIAPADGTVCAIEETFVKEYLGCEALQVSVFMYGTDVHVNRYPVDGTVEYVKYHKGNYFVASYPKSSDLNEHSSVGLRLDNGQRILIRQISGVMARRIVCYAQEGQRVRQNEELGFIKFGSRVDLFLPLDTSLCVDLYQQVKNGVSPLAIVS